MTKAHNNFSYLTTLLLSISLIMMTACGSSRSNTSSSRNSKFNQLLTQAQEYYQAEKYDAALSSYNQALTLNSSSAEALTGRGAVYENLSNLQAAVDDYSKAMNANPQYALAYFYRGNLFYNNKNYRDALPDYKKYVELAPNSALAYEYLADTYARLNDHSRALKDYDTAISLNPDKALVYFNRAAAHDALNHKEAAFRDYKKYLAMDQSDNGTTRQACSRLNDLDWYVKDVLSAMFTNTCNRMQYEGNYETYSPDTQRRNCMLELEVFADGTSTWFDPCADE